MTRHPVRHVIFSSQNIHTSSGGTCSHYSMDAEITNTWSYTSTLHALMACTETLSSPLLISHRAELCVNRSETADHIQFLVFAKLIFFVFRSDNSTEKRQIPNIPSKTLAKFKLSLNFHAVCCRYRSKFHSVVLTYTTRTLSKSVISYRTCLEPRDKQTYRKHTPPCNKHKH